MDKSPPLLSKRFLPAIAKAARDECGIAAVEFAFILPVLLLILLGVIELTNVLSVQRKLLNATQSAADLLGRQTNVTTTDLNNIYLAAELVMSNASGISIGIASVRFDDTTGAPTLDWSDSYNGAVVNNPLLKATGHGEAGASVIIMTATYTYTPIIRLILPNNIILTETIYVRPRIVRWVMKY